MKSELHRGNPLAVLTRARSRKARVTAIAIASSGAVGHKPSVWASIDRPLARAF